MTRIEAAGSSRLERLSRSWWAHDWASNQQVEVLHEPTIEVRVLITRDQLSVLRNALTQVLELAEEGVHSPRNFVAEVKAMAACLGRPKRRRDNPMFSPTVR
ncbi:MAG: hypothetical protein M3495_05360 [Pseudomonadota bacterium]|nr:hypothetical protein [Pseudomonadota bacterium]